MRVLLLLGVLLTIPRVSACAQATPQHVQLLCHRTANKDAPENTMESLEQAALLGCDVVEIDVRRTLDGVLVLNHDGFLERSTDGEGEVETTLYGDLQLREAGLWMGERWRGLHIARLDEALDFARRQHLHLILDIKVKGIGPDVLAALDRADARSLVRFNGEWDEIKRLYSPANHDGNASWLQPGATAVQIDSLHGQGKTVIVNFSANTHEMDLSAMRAAVAAGTDGINVDYPRLGADAVGRPAEAAIAALMTQAASGDSDSRVLAISRLARYRGFRLEPAFAQWLLDTDAHVSRAAAVALVTARPQATAYIFDIALSSPSSGVQANAAWALGALHAPADRLVPLLRSREPEVLQQVLLALAHMPGKVQVAAIVPLLVFPDTRVRGSAAVALAAHQPGAAQALLPSRLRIEVKETLRLYDAWAARGKPSLTPSEIKAITDRYRCEMKFLQAIGTLHGPSVDALLKEQAFHAGDDFTQIHALVASFRLWDRIARSPGDAIRQLASADAGVADRAEWMLILASASVDTAVRRAMRASNADVRTRAILIAACRGDTAALPLLHGIHSEEARWAEVTIRLLQSIKR